MTEAEELFQRTEEVALFLTKWARLNRKEMTRLARTIIDVGDIELDTIERQVLAFAKLGLMTVTAASIRIDAMRASKAKGTEL